MTNIEVFECFLTTVDSNNSTYDGINARLKFTINHCYRNVFNASHVEQCSFHII
jgi:hypothetical protein